MPGPTPGTEALQRSHHQGVYRVKPDSDVLAVVVNVDRLKSQDKVQLKRELLGTGSPLHECPEGAATLKKPSEESLADYTKEPLDSCGTGRKEKSTYSKLQSWPMMRTSRFRMDI